MGLFISTTTPDASVIALDNESAALLPTFVSEAHNNVSSYTTVLMIPP
jgi:hypothetical protein